MAAEITESFECFGSRCSVVVSGGTPESTAGAAASHARRELLSWHRRFSRFIPDSELSRLNADPRSEVPVSALMARFAQVALEAATMTGGLVDATLLDEIESAGYDGDLGHRLPLEMALKLAPPRTPASPAALERWHQIHVDAANGIIARPPGLKLDSGGLAKGLFADVLAEELSDHDAFAINCGGDIHVGGAAALERPIRVESPFDGRILHTFELAHTGVATSGIGRRSWLDGSGRPAHHLLDPASGRPAFTGIVQVTALAPSAALAEIHAKAAILSGPRLAHARLPHGGVIVYDDRSHRVIQPPPAITLRDLSALIQSPASSAAHHV
jgi:thiamine biosynthesis lipoprotein